MDRALYLRDEIVANYFKKAYNNNACNRVIYIERQALMRDELRNKCDLLAENYIITSKKYRWNYSTNNRLGALLYTMEGRTVDTEAVNRCKRMIKRNAGLFSRFKDITYFSTAVILSLKEESEKLFLSAVDIYKSMKQEGFRSSAYLVLAAVSIAMQSEEMDYRRRITAAKSFYEAIKKEHRLLTGPSDYGYIALLALSDQTVSSVTRDIERCYGILMNDFISRNAVQSLTHILAFGEQEPVDKCKRVVDLYEALRKRGIKFGTRLELPVLGVTALLMENPQEAAKDIEEVTQYLSKKKGFGIWLPKKERLIYAAVLVSDEYASGALSTTRSAALTNSITGILLAQQMAVIAASSAAATSAAASSGS